MNINFTMFDKRKILFSNFFISTRLIMRRRNINLWFSVRNKTGVLFCAVKFAKFNHFEDHTFHESLDGREEQLSYEYHMA